MTVIFRPEGRLFRATEQAGAGLGRRICYRAARPEGDWILIRSRTRAGANGAGLTMASLSDRKGAFAEVLQAMTFERRAAQAQAS